MVDHMTDLKSRLAELSERQQAAMERLLSLNEECRTARLELLDHIADGRADVPTATRTFMAKERAQNEALKVLLVVEEEFTNAIGELYGTALAVADGPVPRPMS